MSGSSQHLTLREDRCDRCGACTAVCPRRALKVGTAFIYVDWRSCDGCLQCVEACDRGAIVSRVVPLRSSSVRSTVPVDEVSKVVVGSRSEAKAVRRAAERAAKEAKGRPPVLREARKRTKVDAPRVEERSADNVTVLRREPAPPIGTAVHWTVVDALAVLAVMLLALVAKNQLLALPQVALMPQLGKMAVRTVVLSLFYMAQIAAFGWLSGRHGLPAAVGFGLRPHRSAQGQTRPSVLGSAGLVLGLFVACEIVSIGYGLAIDAAGVVRPESLSSDIAGVFGSGPLGITLAFILVAVAAPFAEEIAFRGIVMSGIGNKWGMWAGILGSAALYGAYHANLWMLPPTFMLGIALGWLTWTRRSLWPAVTLHVLFNAVAVAAAFATVR